MAHRRLIASVAVLLVFCFHAPVAHGQTVGGFTHGTMTRFVFKADTSGRKWAVDFDTAAVRNSTWLKTILDSVIASGGPADSLFARRPHSWNAAQLWIDTLASGGTVYPWEFQVIDTTAARVGLTMTRGAWTNGPAGAANYHSTIWGWQYNPFRDDVTQPRFGNSLESKYYVSGHWHSEYHLFYDGVGAQLGVRPLTWIGRWGDGRVTSLGLNADIVDFANGGGANNGNWDSLTVRLYLRGGAVGPTGVLGLLNGTLIRADSKNSVIIQAYNGSTYGNVFLTSGDTQLFLGSANWTDMTLQAGTKTFTLSNSGVITTNCFVAASASDSDKVIGFNENGNLVARWKLSLATILSRITDSLNTIPRSGGSGITSDSAARLGRQYFVTARMPWSSAADTSNARWLSVEGNARSGPGSSAQVFIAPYPMVIDRIAITHSYDTSTSARRRDTLATYTVRDSIPAGAAVYIYYAPASDAIFNGTGAQIVGVFYKAQNDLNTAYLIGDRVKLPLILGILRTQMGARSDHWVVATLSLVEKIPGRVY